MIEVSDRPFGGVSNHAKISWTAEKFREALLEIADPETREQAMENLVGGRGADEKVEEVELEVKERGEEERGVSMEAEVGTDVERRQRRKRRR